MLKNCRKEKLIMAKDADLQLNVADVYDLAAEIGREFEKVIDVYGTDGLRELMTKVIIILEYLESGTLVIDNLQEELTEIKSRVTQLEYEKLEKAEFRTKLEQELEQIEENWRKEINQLNSMVAKLQEENKRLSNLLSDKEHTPPDQAKDDQYEQLQKLKQCVDQQRTQLLNKDKEYLQKCGDIEKLEIAEENLKATNRELTHKNKYMQKQMRLLVEEKSDLQAYVQDQQKDYEILQNKFTVTMRENYDLVTAEEKHSMDLAGKLVISLDDPNRPRFTLDELRHILFERNDLKAKVSDLEDELSLHRKKKNPPITPCTSPIPPLAATSDEVDLPVQGPINREPDEKLYPERKAFGIRRFFHFLRRFSVDRAVEL